MITFGVGVFQDVVDVFLKDVTDRLRLFLQPNSCLYALYISERGSVFVRGSRPGDIR